MWSVLKWLQDFAWNTGGAHLERRRARRIEKLCGPHHSFFERLFRGHGDSSFKYQVSTWYVLIPRYRVTWTPRSSRSLGRPFSCTKNWTHCSSHSDDTKIPCRRNWAYICFTWFPSATFAKTCLSCRNLFLHIFSALIQSWSAFGEAVRPISCLLLLKCFSTLPKLTKFVIKCTPDNQCWGSGSACFWASRIH